MNKKITTLALLGLGISAAHAAPFALQAGPIFMQFNNLEQVGALGTSYAAKDLNGDGVNDIGPAPLTTEYNWGIFNLSSVQLGGVSVPNTEITGGSAYFADDGVSPDTFGQGQISGIFYGIENNADGNPTTANGGWIDFYWEEEADDDITQADLNGGIAPSIRTDWNVAGKFTDGVLLARLQFASGIIDGDTTTTFSSTTDPLTSTLEGVANGYANVSDVNGDGVITSADGAWAVALNGDWFFVDNNNNAIKGEAGETRDFRFTTRYAGQDLWDGPGTPPAVQGLTSNDPARAFNRNIPEPATIALLGVGLLGFGAARRRKA